MLLEKTSSGGVWRDRKVVLFNQDRCLAADVERIIDLTLATDHDVKRHPVKNYYGQESACQLEKLLKTKLSVS